MASSNPCSVCPKGASTCYCLGCKAYFCRKDFRNHQEMLAHKLDELTANRNELDEKINRTKWHKHSGDIFLSQIDAWQEETIEKVKQAAQQVREQVLQILNSQPEEIKRQFQALSQQMEHLRETEDVLEHDLSKLKNQIETLNKSLENLSQPPEIKLNTKQSEQIIWNRMIYVEDTSASSIREQHPIHPHAEGLPPPTPIAKKPECDGRACEKCGKCTDWYYFPCYDGLGGPDWQRREGATCTSNLNYSGYGRYYSDPWHDHRCRCDD